jgi:hypothetical protein
MDLPTRDTPPLRVRQLMSHSAGFPEDNPWGDQQLSANDAALDAWLRAGIPFSTAPGTRYEYSNYAFGLLGRLVTKASGTPYEKYVRQEILTKLQWLQDEVGECTVAGPMIPENWLRGQFNLQCAKGTVGVFFTLSPTQPPAVQHLEFRKLPSENARMVAPTGAPAGVACSQ